MEKSMDRKPILTAASSASVLALTIVVPAAAAQVDTESALRATTFTALDAPGIAGPTSSTSGSGGTSTKAKQATDKPTSKFKTGDLPAGKAVPMQEFRVGPLYGNRGPHTGGVHGGLDLSAKEGEPIYAVASGKVAVAGWQGAAGKSVTIQVNSGKYVLYGHMSKITAQNGERVKAGEKIGEVGSTGNSTGPHLHLQVELAGSGTIDPLPWLGASAKELVRFGRS
jgi:murein DD-endopeptidase MepM/ murein hydrolase activator NlpD